MQLDIDSDKVHFLMQLIVQYRNNKLKDLKPYVLISDFEIEVLHWYLADEYNKYNEVNYANK